MANRVISRRFIALLAAYVMGLQSLLLPLAVAVANPLTTSVCVSDSGTPGPASHDGACACAAGCGMTCCAQGLSGAAQASLLIERLWVRAGLAAQPMSVARFAEARGPQNPRAPPAV